MRISLHGRARVNIRQFFSRLVLGVHSQQTFVTVKKKKVRFLMKFLSCMCTEDISEVLFLVRLLIRPALCCCHSKSIVVTHIKTIQRLGIFADLLILAAKHAGQNVSAVYWPRYCHTMPPQGSVMGGQVWPQWKSFSCHVSHFHSRGNMYVGGCSVWTCEFNQKVLSSACEQGKTKGCDYFITWHLHDAFLTTWRWTRCHFPLLDPFVNISVYYWCQHQILLPV